MRRPPPPPSTVRRSRRGTEFQGHRTNESGGAFRRRRPQPLKRERVLVQLARNVVERRVELVTDALHRTDGGNGNQGRDQAIFNGRRALGVLQQLHKLGHLWSPNSLMQG